MPQQLGSGELAESADPGGIVGPLDRGLTVLRALAAGPEGRQRPGDLVHATGLARSTVDRITTTLLSLGYLRAEGRDLLLTPQAMTLGSGYLACCRLPDVLGPCAAELADALDESVSLAVPDGDGVRFITQVIHRRAMSLAFRIGDLLPPERCAPGPLFAAGWSGEDGRRWLERLRADPGGTGFPAVPAPSGPLDAAAVERRFLARVAAAREQGWSVDDQLIEPGLVAVALPVRDASGTAVCALSVVSHTSRHSAASLADHALPHLRRTAARMEASLRDAPPYESNRPARPADESELKNRLGAEFLQSLARGLAVLRALGTRSEGLSLSRVAEATGQPRATARRSLLTLTHLGYVRAGQRTFTLTPRVLDLGYAPLSGLGFTDVVQPHLAALTALLGESSSVAVLDGDDVRYVARMATVRIMSVNITVGTRFPAYATAMGRVLLADLPAAGRAAYLARVRPRRLTRHTRTGAAELAAAIEAAGKDGFALVDEELEEGLRSVAVPLRSADGRVVAALNVAQHAGRGSREQMLDRIRPAATAAAERIAADLAIVGERRELTIP
ncbi:helix-turn-helix domain-containing protein [Streptomyces sp. NBC_01476]|uniref:IclR family transcriptional regulator domain-containing protein n=1 Tax=Streptomyces sp. NBC_01476 TaxID=2903881 RepID=UPI002E2F44C0|nr:IclR family transcriptional regulator C-terminal domain-containing protein [Streptomyces sp. NBC_01476]